MSLIEILTSRICQQFQLGTDSPLADCISWIDSLNLDGGTLLSALEEVLARLEAESEALRQEVTRDITGSPGQGHWRIAQHEYWCYYCSLICSHYRDIVKH
ncbi:hypothetical protein [Marinimicrobium sp. ABcell2]|uniref:hypothetical protein n=1 Tax=Marinimicrobium sp. ABcell2 TaxID=3069751 RepID=UPI0027B16BEA|nr:hypothetical protein [Marinimicrobium sp. ABcell2]MDQ2075838.1 hypothetical protein [Marinimicrobium sp. ABcell2]